MMNDDLTFREMVRALLAVLKRPGTYAYFARGFERPGVPPLLSILILLNEDVLEGNRGPLAAHLQAIVNAWEQGE